MNEQRADYDSPWKEIIEQFFPEFLQFFFPTTYAAIDWTRKPTFLNPELKKLQKESKTGKFFVDKVAKVRLIGRKRATTLVHVEVQAQWDRKLPLRMYQYNYRLFDFHKRRVISLALLADNRQNWRPSSYGYSEGGSSNHFSYPVAKLLDYQTQLDSLESSDNPFGLVVCAHLRTLKTTRNPQNRLNWKLHLVQKLYERRYDWDYFQALFRFIDWVMILPESLANNFKAEVEKYEEVYQVRYVTSIEQLAKQEGRVEGRAEGRAEGKVENARENIIKILQVRFGEISEHIQALINAINELPQLGQLLTTSITITSIEEFQQVLETIVSGE